jgi:hypothetical protein
MAIPIPPIPARFASTLKALSFSACIGLSLASSACATVRPEQRQLLADPMMQFKGGERDERAKEHVLEYREGAIGGGSVKGGGCGCN